MYRNKSQEKQQSRSTLYAQVHIWQKHVLEHTLHVTRVDSKTKSVVKLYVTVTTHVRDRHVSFFFFLFIFRHLIQFLPTTEKRERTSERERFEKPSLQVKPSLPSGRQWWRQPCEGGGVLTQLGHWRAYTDDRILLLYQHHSGHDLTKTVWGIFVCVMHMLFTHNSQFSD